MRLPNGYGACYKLSGKRRKPWVAKKFIGWGQTAAGNTKPVYGVVGYFATKTEALQALAKYNENPTDLLQKDKTFTDVYTEWAAVKYPQISASMACDYKGAYKYCSLIHNRIFRDLVAYDYESMVAHTDIPRSYLKRINVLLSQLYQYAMKHDIVTRDISELVEIKEDNEVRSVRNLFHADDLSNLRAFQGDTVSDMVRVSLYTGMRPTEVASIREDDVDLENRIIVGGIKTKAGKNRRIPIHSEILSLITERVKKARFEGYKAIFLNENGNPMSYKTYRLWFNQMYVDHTPYDCRHTFASCWHLCGLDPLIEKLIMGHAVVDITKGIYTHIPDERLVEEIDKLVIC